LNFVDDDGSIVVPKSVRPIIEYSTTALGSSCGAIRQFRTGKLHIREYDDYYSVHSDKVAPINDPLGHLIIDAPEYLFGMLSGISIYSTLKDYNSRNSHSSSKIGVKDGISPCFAGIFAAYTGYGITKYLKKLARGRG
jgi:hypothetical protein